MSRSHRPVLPVALLALLLTGLSACTDNALDRLVAPGPTADVAGQPGITVMSQNLYLGADLDALLAAQTPEELAGVFQQLQITSAGNMGRMQQIAWQIAQRAPHLAGLQEVTRYTFSTAAGTDTLDYVTILQAYLNYFYAMGLSGHTYQVVRQPLTEAPPQTVALPTGDLIVTYQDGDAILIRDDVSLVGDPTMVKYDMQQTLVVGGTPFTNYRGYIAVTADVDGVRLRFVNTHLEVQMFRDVQVAQSAQLIHDLADETLPVVLVGDFNSAANHDAPADQKSPSYRMLRQAHFGDMWLREAHSVSGVTCCQAPDLLNDVSMLSQRLDLVLVRWGPASFGGRSAMEVVGDEPGDRVTVTDPVVGTVTLWPSDHAAVAATLWPAPGHIW
ncbi:MAG: endonuclease/exonuclease/phosphatase family protein [Gemmatimonadota bacterium]|jgi:endonuclease/exonuclease/phosphatase family metal-dependent hydrolase